MYETIERTLARIDYKPGYYFEWDALVSTSECGGLDKSVFLLRVFTEAPCTQTGKMEIQAGRWFVIDEPLDPGCIVRTAYQAIYLFELHELQEHFRFNGKVVFDPHHLNGVEEEPAPKKDKYVMGSFERDRYTDIFIIYEREKGYIDGRIMELPGGSELDRQKAQQILDALNKGAQYD